MTDLDAQPMPDSEPAAEADDLPAATPFGPEFGLAPPTHDGGGGSWLPERVEPLPETFEPAAEKAPVTTPVAGAPTPIPNLASGPQTRSERRAAAPDRVGPAPVGRRLRTSHVVVGLALLFLPVFLWFALSLANADTTPRATPARPSESGGRSTANASATTGTGRITKTTTPRLTGSTGPPATAPRSLPTGARPGAKPLQSAAPTLTAVPPAVLTPVKPGAKVMRFEAHGPKGQLLEVSLTDAAHQRFDYPVAAGPLGFELPVGSTSVSGDYYSIRVRAPGSADARHDVMCRIYVDDVLVTQQQGQGYTSCYISPYYDVRRS